MVKVFEARAKDYYRKEVEEDIRQELKPKVEEEFWSHHQKLLSPTKPESKEDEVFEVIAG